jgi:cytochrome c553
MQKRYTTVLSISVATLFLMGMSAVQAEKLTRPGGYKTAHCEHCHGPYGCKPVQGLMPKLFRDGTRISPIMSQTTKLLSDELIRQLAAYFANAPTSDK